MQLREQSSATLLASKPASASRGNKAVLERESGCSGPVRPAAPGRAWEEAPTARAAKSRGSWVEQRHLLGGAGCVEQRSLEGLAGSGPEGMKTWWRGEAGGTRTWALPSPPRCLHSGRRVLRGWRESS